LPSAAVAAPVITPISHLFLLSLAVLGIVAGALAGVTLLPISDVARRPWGIVGVDDGRPAWLATGIVLAAKLPIAVLNGRS